MANTTLNASIIAKAAVGILENELVMANAVYRGYEDEFGKKINGYTVGDTVTIQKPTDFTVRSTITASPQDVTEGKTSIVVNQIAGVDFAFTSQQLTLNIGELSERVIRPAMIQIANQIDVQVMALYKDIPQYVGTPGTLVQSFAGFAKGAQNMDQRSVPQGNRTAIPGACRLTGRWPVRQTALFNNSINGKSYRQGASARSAASTPICRRTLRPSPRARSAALR
jgi:hypothetical protein